MAVLTLPAITPLKKVVSCGVSASMRAVRLLSSPQQTHAPARAGPARSGTAFPRGDEHPGQQRTPYAEPAGGVEVIAEEQGPEDRGRRELEIEPERHGARPGRGQPRSSRTGPRQPPASTAAASRSAFFASSRMRRPPCACDHEREHGDARTEIQETGELELRQPAEQELAERRGDANSAAETMPRSMEASFTRRA